MLYWWEGNRDKSDKMPDGRLATKTKHEYSLQDKINLINSHLLSKNLPHISEEMLLKA